MTRAVTVLALFATCLISPASPAAPPADGPKQPWEITLDERIALRSDVKLAQQRVGEAGRLKTTATVSNNVLHPWVDEFTGKTHPELFLPHEVFREFMNLAFQGAPRMRQIIHEGLTPDVKRHQLPADFWPRLESISAAYIGDVWAERDLLASLQKQRGSARDRAQRALVLKQADICRSRADALAAARSEFGRERFDRFLYEVIAVNMFHAADRVDDRELLQTLEGGCR